MRDNVRDNVNDKDLIAVDILLEGVRDLPQWLEVIGKELLELVHWAVLLERLKSKGSVSEKHNTLHDVDCFFWYYTSELFSHLLDKLGLGKRSIAEKWSYQLDYFLDGALLDSIVLDEVFDLEVLDEQERRRRKLRSKVRSHLVEGGGVLHVGKLEHARFELNERSIVLSEESRRCLRLQRYSSSELVSFNSALGILNGDSKGRDRKNLVGNEVSDFVVHVHLLVAVKVRV